MAPTLLAQFILNLMQHCVKVFFFCKFLELFIISTANEQAGKTLLTICNNIKNKNPIKSSSSNNKYDKNSSRGAINAAAPTIAATATATAKATTTTTTRTTITTTTKTTIKDSGSGLQHTKNVAKLRKNKITLKNIHY
ncbi:hypothetical protein PoB_003343700 [Plakobranchus ocellatus]|uniref:Uncharacterized protein n=1 Tax=Plakobranchus ocellatus TaxID=259542 RepID=A0AAV4AIW1_9GAST|nr:hypothetical protein PoB_003343700 [Plakobranchus ocellatus]